MKIVIIEHVSGKPQVRLAVAYTHEDAILISHALAFARTGRPDVSIMAFATAGRSYSYNVAHFNCRPESQALWSTLRATMPAEANAARKKWKATQAAEKALTEARKKILLSMPPGRFDELMKHDAFRLVFCGPTADLIKAREVAQSLGLPLADEAVKEAA